MRTNAITVRRLVASDPPLISAAFTAFEWDKPAGLYEKYLAEQQTGWRDVFVALVQGDFAGYVTLNWRPTYPPFQAEGTPEIHDLNVLPRFRRQGAGSALMDAAEVEARARSAAVGVGVGLTPDYGAAQQLYVQRGYVPDGRGISYGDLSVEYGEEVVVDDDLVLRFTKRLSGSNPPDTTERR